jgi:hypothetical protein
MYESGNFPYGPNMAVRRSVIGIQDPWPEHLGPGRALPVGDEMVFVQNLGAAGRERLYTPDCVVEHRPVIRGNFLFRSLKRCLQGGYVAGRYSIPEPRAGTSRSMAGLAQSRLTGSRSVQEFCCISARATGYFFGFACRRLLPGSR